MPTITYSAWEQFPGWSGAPDWIAALVRRHAARHVLEIGAGANPTLPLDRLADLGIAQYTTNDVSADELAKAPPGYETLCADFTDPALVLARQYDFICSRMVNEHVRDGETYFRNIYRALTPGGVTAHAFSTLYALPFLANRLMPEAVSSALLNLFAPRDRHQHDKFRAYYSWSRGPTVRQIRRFERLGFEVLEYRGFFGHRYYEHRLAPLHRAELAKERWLLRHPIPQLTAYATVVLRRPR
ncbi:methyltransferase domain-containing protein [Pseudogemmatithrix spongiicola]|uniref:Methyltransferase domain-containing protein n=1 Tax=Pseudogemmatithrix spongiicola TaxID=3062599 RepID=A0AA49Q7R4_9BACT|nr:methyltransferase domain-containing protein [Gemmatimonadaceae bacterium 'strain 138']WKW15342.1 methyltransferase domain-containing protein [Gemmatimonadaceae bacterium 'strain 318']